MRHAPRYSPIADELAIGRHKLPVALLEKPRFAIGDHVTVSESCKYFSDWRGARLIIARIDMDREGRVTYGTYDLDCPSDGMTDEWKEHELGPAS